MKLYEISEAWSKKYKDSINCSNPKGFSQKAHCAGKKKKVKEYGVPDYTTMPTYKLKKASKGKQKFFLPSNEPTPKGVLAIENFSKPQFDVEWNEANRYPFLNKLGIDGWIELAQTGKVANVNSDSVKKIGNTGADGSETFDDLNPDKVARFTQAQKSGTIEMPIVMKMPNGKLELIAGNTRLIGLMNSTGKAKVWYIDASKLNEDVTKGNFGGVIYPRLPHEEVLDAISSWEYGDTPIELSNGYVINAREEGYNADDNAWVLLDPQGKIVDHGEGSIEGVMQDFTPIAIEENFADGKKKGKSRPGRVKRSGASCKGSVTSLRAKAKKYSGERGKMYHWCANMKSGKKKKTNESVFDNLQLPTWMSHTSLEKMFAQEYGQRAGEYLMYMDLDSDDDLAMSSSMGQMALEIAKEHDINEINKFFSHFPVNFHATDLKLNDGIQVWRLEQNQQPTTIH